MIFGGLWPAHHITGQINSKVCPCRGHSIFETTGSLPCGTDVLSKKCFDETSLRERASGLTITITPRTAIPSSSFRFGYLEGQKLRTRARYFKGEKHEART